MGEVGFGLLTSAAAVGGLVGTSSYDWLEQHVALGTLMRACLTLEVFIHLALALTDTPWVALVILFVFGAYAFVWGTLAADRAPARRTHRVPGPGRQRLPGRRLRRPGASAARSAACIGRHFGITAPFWFAFAGSAVILALIWRQLPQIAHAD